MGRPAGQLVSALPAAQLSSWFFPSGVRIWTVAGPSLSGRHSCTFEPLLMQTLPPAPTSMSQMLGLCATSEARSAPKRPRWPAADASATCLASKSPGPRRVCALLGPMTVTTSPPTSEILALSGSVLPGGYDFADGPNDLM